MGLGSLVLFGVLSGASPSPAAAPVAPPPLVAVGPFGTASAEEHHWLSFALAEMLVARLGRGRDVSVLSVRQWGAVLRERDLALVPLQSDGELRSVGRSLGARYVLHGSYVARWPEVTVQVRILDVSGGPTRVGAQATALLQDVATLEDALVTQLSKVLGLQVPPAGRPRNTLALHHAMRCRELLLWQSLTPRAPPMVPRAAAAQAEESCNKALARDARDADALEGRGLARALQGDVPGALQSLAAAQLARGAPDMAEVAESWIHFRSGDGARAVAVLEKAVEKRPTFLHARGVLGQTLLELGRLAEAATVFEAYLRLAPNQPWALAMLGYARARGGDPHGGVELTRAALAVAPGDPWLQLELASRYIDAKDYPAAEGVLRQAVQVDPQSAVGYLRLGYVFVLQGEDGLARPMLQKALMEADLEAEYRVRGYAHVDLARLDARAGATAGALHHLRQAVAEGFINVDAWETDPDLRALHKDPSFGQVLAQGRTARARWALLPDGMAP